MKAKDLAASLSGLSAATSGMTGNYNVADVEADIPEELQEPDPIFFVEHEEILKANENKAYKSIQQIVNTIVPDYYQGNPVIKDKMKQDASQLGQLYYQQSMNNIMIKAIMDTIAKGAIEARMFDSYTKLMSIAKEFNKQINEMQNQFRKYYIDTYLDLQHKEEEDQVIEASDTKTLTTVNKGQQTIMHQTSTEGNIDLRETSTKDTVIKTQEWKKEIYRKKFEEEQTKNN